MKRNVSALTVFFLITSLTVNMVDGKSLGDVDFGKDGWQVKHLEYTFPCEGSAYEDGPCHGQEEYHTITIEWPAYTVTPLLTAYNTITHTSDHGCKYGGYGSTKIFADKISDTVHFEGESRSFLSGKGENRSYGPFYAEPVKVNIVLRQCADYGYLYKTTFRKDVYYKNLGSCDNFCMTAHDNWSRGRVVQGEQYKQCECYCKEGDVKVNRAYEGRWVCETTTTTLKTTTTTFPQYDKDKEYCGPEKNDIIMKIIPRGHLFSGVDFNRGCYEHDRCYAECGQTGKSKESCDSEFRERLHGVCESVFDIYRSMCLQRGWYNPFRYSCLTITKKNEWDCYGTANTYWAAVAAGANMFDAYPCGKKSEPSRPYTPQNPHK
ncbi:MAG: hypothetical protein ABIH11_07295 [Candidatus Altiarchaeota archaeon]